MKSRIAIGSLILACASCMGPAVTEAPFKEMQWVEFPVDTAESSNTLYSLQMDFTIKDVTSLETQTFCFQRPFADGDMMMPAYLMSCADGGGKGYYLSRGLKEATASGVVFHVTCSYDVAAGKGKVEKDVFIPWLTPAGLTNDQMTLNAEWKTRRPNTASQYVGSRAESDADGL